MAARRVAQAYTVDTGCRRRLAPRKPQEAGPDFATVLAAADAAAGEKSLASARPATRLTADNAPARI
jgi:hypothetical protein